MKEGGWSLSSRPWRKEEAVISIIYLVLIIPHPTLSIHVFCRIYVSHWFVWDLSSFPPSPVLIGNSHSPWSVSFLPWGLTTVTIQEHRYLTTYFMSHKSSFLYQFTFPHFLSFFSLLYSYSLHSFLSFCLSLRRQPDRNFTFQLNSTKKMKSTFSFILCFAAWYHAAKHNAHP